MRVLFFICSLLSIFSCGHFSNTNIKISQKEEDINSVVIAKTDTTKIRLSKGVEKVIIEFWDSYYANNFIFNILSFDTETEITYKGETLFTEKQILKDSISSSRLIIYINQFYIDKKDNIVLTKSKNNEMLITDYPSIKVMGYKDKKEIFNVNTQIGDEEYDIEFHPKFLEFYNLLESLIKEK